MLASTPWYRAARRWGQTNITEVDPQRYDIAWWREHWRATRVQGVIINAGGIVAYYPSSLPQHRAQFLDGRDLFGDITAAAREEGLAVIARMDCNRTREPFYREHRDWFAVEKNAEPYRSGEFYFTCVNSPYYEQFIPQVLQEVVSRYRPDGFGDNSWCGMSRDAICYCENCARRFHDYCELPLPDRPDWGTPSYRQWITWSYRRRLENWDLLNRVTRQAGGPHCLWMGMVMGSPVAACQRLMDLKPICERSPFLLLDFQARDPAVGFQDNADKGLLLNALLPEDAAVIESMAMYQSPNPTFRLASRPQPEARLWMVEGFAGTIQPWWHHIGAYHEDRRQYRTAEPLLRWHEQNEQYLINRRPVATVGIVWSQRSMDFFGRDDALHLCEMPYRGVMQAMVRRRIPYVPVHIDDIGRVSGSLDTLVLPNIGAMTRDQCEAVRRFVQSGKGLLVTGDSSRCDESGEALPDFALADVLGVHSAGPCPTVQASSSHSWEHSEGHTYLRLHPELRAQVYGPHAGTEPPVGEPRHAVLDGFGETDLLPFGGRLTKVSVDARRQVLVTFVPSFPIYPPETSWMRTPSTDQPGLVLTTRPAGGRVAYLAASLDYCFARDNLPDHGDVLANAVRWLSPRGFPLEVDGPGLLDCRLYHQPGRAILHIVNLTNPGAWRPPVHELTPVGPLRVRLRLHPGVAGTTVRFLVAGTRIALVPDAGRVGIDIASILDHEVLVIE